MRVEREPERCDFCGSRERVAVSADWPGEPVRICLSCAQEALRLLDEEGDS